MAIRFGIERRDPVSFVLMLGQMLTDARERSGTGRVEVLANDVVYSIEIQSGAIVSIESTNCGQCLERGNLSSRIENIFALERPRILWTSNSTSDIAHFSVDPRHIIVDGVTSRRDLFEPVLLLNRIPLETLTIDPSNLGFIQAFPFTEKERLFIEQLRVPTPIPMILWKRGLEPRHAGSLLMALNLAGCFAKKWAPGDLPRNIQLAKTRRKMLSSCPDFEILGVNEDASFEEIKKAFRRLSFDLHPDRMAGLPTQEAAQALKVFAGVSEAYERMKRSRRSRPVLSDPFGLSRTGQSGSRSSYLEDLLDEVRQSTNAGDHKRARAFAIKALAQNPPKGVKIQLVSIIKRAAA